MSLRGARQGDAAISLYKNEMLSAKGGSASGGRAARNDVMAKKEGLTMRHIYASLLAVSLIILTATSICFATDYDYKTMTPDIEKALKSRQARYYQLQKFKEEGMIGENNKGYVAELKGGDAISMIAADENRDRRVLYEALAEQNKLGSTGLLEVQKAFAAVQEEKAGPGDMVQSASGDWKRKA